MFLVLSGRILYIFLVRGYRNPLTRVWYQYGVCCYLLGTYHQNIFGKGLYVLFGGEISLYPPDRRSGGKRDLVCTY